MRRVVFTILVFGVCTACAASVALAQNPRGAETHDVRITGTVQTPDGSRLPGVTLRVFGTGVQDCHGQ